VLAEDTRAALVLLLPSELAMELQRNSLQTFLWPVVNANCPVGEEELAAKWLEALALASIFNTQIILFGVVLQEFNALQAFLCQCLSK